MEIWKRTRESIENEKFNAVKAAKRGRSENNKSNSANKVCAVESKISDSAYMKDIKEIKRYYDSILINHERFIQEAINEGKTVPHEVLKEYENLVLNPAKTSLMNFEDFSKNVYSEKINFFHLRTGMMIVAHVKEYWNRRKKGYCTEDIAPLKKMIDKAIYDEYEMIVYEATA